MENQEALKRLAALTVAPTNPALHALWVMTRTGIATGKESLPVFKKHLAPRVDAYLSFKQKGNVD